MTIHFLSPYSFDYDLGKAYNDAVNLVTDKEDWVCISDGDTMFLSSDYGHQLKEIIDLYPTTGLFTCLSNRVGTLKQCYNNEISEESNILEHRKIALKLSREKRHEVKPIQAPISGQLMLFKKETFDSIGGFPEQRGILTVDNTFSNRMKRNGYNILVMEGIYILHYYRMLEGRQDKSHLLKK